MVRIAEAALLAVVVAVIAILFYDPGVTTEGFKREEIPKKEVSNSEFKRTYEYFDSRGTQIEAWLYTPIGVSNPPIVILAPGLGLQKHFKLDTVAEAFVKKGLAALVFDYRHFGGSDGEPRNLVKVSQQVSDYHAAIKHVTTLPGINSKKIGLWGASFAGGHVLTATVEQIARKNPNITCIVSRAPYLDSLDVLTSGSTPVPVLGKRLLLALKDLVLSFFGKDQYVPLFADHTTFSAVTVSNPAELKTTTGATDGAFGWRNIVPARAFLEMLLYRPSLYASSITVPTLIVYATDDETVSASQVEKTAASMPHATVHKVKGTHWQTYTNAEVLETEATFLAKHLL